ncbi:MAG TPA: cell wall hydrolase [Allosphingosinicella sp.]
MPSAELTFPALRWSLPAPKATLSGVVLALAAALYLVAGLSLASLDRPTAEELAAREAGLTPSEFKAPPKPEPLIFKQVAPTDALTINASVPVAKGPNPAAFAFPAGFASTDDRARALECLTAAVYYEAAIEPLEGQRAVAQVVLNRVRHPAYPRSVCGVVFQGSGRRTGCQFTFTCDGSLRRTPSAAGWARARRVAEEALSGKVYAPVGWATHYHTNWVVPYWSSSLVKAANVGTHIFYRWTGGWGRPGAFRRGPAGTEASMASLRAAADAARAALPPLGESVDDAAAAAALAAAQAADPDRVVTASVDSFQRAVLRRYEPMSRETATAKAIERTAEPVSASTRWALGGERASDAAPFGRKAEEKAAPPKCLEGVRRPPADGEGPAEKQAC